MRILQLSLRPQLIFIISILIGITVPVSGYLPPGKFLKNTFKTTRPLTAVVLNNDCQTLPLIININKLKMASIAMGFSYNAAFDSLLNKYQKIDRLNSKPYLEHSSFDALKDDIKFYDILLLQLTDNYATNEQVIQFIKEVEQKKIVIIAFFGKGKNLNCFDSIKSPLIWCDQSSFEAAMYIPQIIFGGVAVNTKLKVTYSKIFTSGSGSCIIKNCLGYPNLVKVENENNNLQRIDSVVLEAINQKATPSAVVMVVKDGEVIYNKAFGTHTYEGLTPTTIDDVYDLASVTKIAATTLEVMHLTETGEINLENPLKKYIGRTRGTDKEHITLRDLMLHQAGFIPFIPFYKKIAIADFSCEPTKIFSTKVTDTYFLRKNYFEDIMWPQMLKSPLVSQGKYVYSDLSMYFMKEVIENVTGKKLDDIVSEQFYKPLGMKTAGFNPRNHFNANQIIPTENDTIFRKTLLIGYVHDQGAAMAGGVAGHAGMFASSNDLAILFQMLLNGGNYGGKKYFDPKTINLFTSKQSIVSRRGLGFDRRDPDTSKAYPSKLASLKTYGHTGYTGTCVWVDPAYNLIYIFLSNRINPQVSGTLGALNIRSRIQDVIYEAIQKENQ